MALNHRACIGIVEFIVIDDVVVSHRVHRECIRIAGRVYRDGDLFGRPAFSAGFSIVGFENEFGGIPCAQPRRVQCEAEFASAVDLRRVLVTDQLNTGAVKQTHDQIRIGIVGHQACQHRLADVGDVVAAGVGSAVAAVRVSAESCHRDVRQWGRADVHRHVQRGVLGRIARFVGVDEAQDERTVLRQIERLKKVRGAPSFVDGDHLYPAAQRVGARAVKQRNFDHATVFVGGATEFDVGAVLEFLQAQVGVALKTIEHRVADDRIQSDGQGLGQRKIAPFILRHHEIGLLALLKDLQLEKDLGLPRDVSDWHRVGRFLVDVQHAVAVGIVPDVSGQTLRDLPLQFGRRLVGFVVAQCAGVSASASVFTGCQTEIGG